MKIARACLLSRMRLDELESGAVHKDAEFAVTMLAVGLLVLPICQVLCGKSDRERLGPLPLKALWRQSFLSWDSYEYKLFRLPHENKQALITS